MRYLKIVVLATVVVTSSGIADTKTDRHPASALDIPPKSTDGVQSLPGVTVQRRMDPLSRSDRRIARLKKLLPDAPANTPAREDAGDRVHDYLAAHSDPNAATGEQRTMMKSAERNPPEAIPNDGSGSGR